MLLFICNLKVPIGSRLYQVKVTPSTLPKQIQALGSLHCYLAYFQTSFDVHWWASKTKEKFSGPLPIPPVKERRIGRKERREGWREREREKGREKKERKKKRERQKERWKKRKRDRGGERKHKKDVTCQVESVPPCGSPASLILQQNMFPRWGSKAYNVTESLKSHQPTYSGILFSPEKEGNSEACQAWLDLENILLSETATQG